MLAYYTIVRILMYIFCAVVVAGFGFLVVKSNKISEKIAGCLFILIILYRLFMIH